MFRLIKMDLYRMFHTKSLYIIWIILSALIIFTTTMSKQDYEYMQSEWEKGDLETISEESNNNMELGLMVMLPTKAGEQVTVFDQIFANMQSKWVALCLVIFAVLFSMEDIKSGYIKNIGGQIRERGNLIFSKAVVLLIYTILTLCLYLGIQVICQYATFGVLKWGDMEFFWRYFGTQAILYYALVLLCMAMSIILKSNVIAMTLAVCSCLNVFVVLYGFVDKVLQDMGMKNFHLIEHTVIGKISLLSMTPKISECLNAIGIAGGFGVVGVFLAFVVFRRRDI